MSLILKIEKDSITSDCATVTAKDNTGNYDAVTAPNGYGSPNETRANLGLILFVTAKRTSGDETIAVTNSDSTDPGAVAEFTFTHGVDTWYELFLCGIKDWAGSYNTNEITYSPTTQKFYKSTANSNINDPVTLTDWVETTSKADFEAAQAAPQADTYFDTENIIEYCNGQICFNKKVLDAECSCQDPCSLGNYEKIRLKLEAMLVHFGLTNYTKAQELMESITEECADTNDCTNC